MEQATASTLMTGRNLIERRGKRGVSGKAVLGSNIRNVTGPPPPWPAPPDVQPHRPLIGATAALAVVLAVAALIVGIVALARPAAAPTYSAAQGTTEKACLCDQYRLAVDAIHVKTDGTDAALARISATNGAAILEAATADPALDTKYRYAALALAQSYRAMAAAATRGSEDGQFQVSLNKVAATEHVMEDLCGD